MSLMKGTGFAFTLFMMIVIGILSGNPSLSTAASKKILSASEIYQRSRNSVVLVISVDQNNTPLALGSGFYVQDKIIITNEHVVRGGSRFIIRRIGENKSYPAKLFVTTKRLDLAALRLTDTSAGAKSLPLEPQINGQSGSSQIGVGEPVVTIGNPRGLQGSVSSGIVSGFRITDGKKMIQITAPISPGSSGGPVFDARGTVIGVATATLRDGQNLNFAVPATYIPDVLSGKVSGEAGNSTKKTRVILKNSNAGLGLSHYQRGYCETESFSIKNTNTFSVKNILGILLYYNSENGEPIANEIFRIAESIQPGMAKMTTWNSVSNKGIGQGGCKFLYAGTTGTTAKFARRVGDVTLYNVKLRILDYEISGSGSEVIDVILGK